MKLHPNQKQPHSWLHQQHTTDSYNKTLCPPKIPPPVSQTCAFPLHTQPPVILSSQLSVQQSDVDAECHGGDEDFVPVRDINTQSTEIHRSAHLHPRTMKMSNMQLGPEETREVPQTEGSAETDVRTVQYLLGELKTLLAGQGILCLFSRMSTKTEHSRN